MKRSFLAVLSAALLALTAIATAQTQAISPAEAPVLDPAKVHIPDFHPEETVFVSDDIRSDSRLDIKTDGLATNLDAAIHAAGSTATPREVIVKIPELDGPWSVQRIANAIDYRWHITDQNSMHRNEIVLIMARGTDRALEVQVRLGSAFNGHYNQMDIDKIVAAAQSRFARELANNHIADFSAQVERDVASYLVKNANVNMAGAVDVRTQINEAIRSQAPYPLPQGYNDHPAYQYGAAPNNDSGSAF